MVQSSTFRFDPMICSMLLESVDMNLGDTIPLPSLQMVDHRRNYQAASCLISYLQNHMLSGFITVMEVH
jgi:hypothetical protein